MDGGTSTVVLRAGAARIPPLRSLEEGLPRPVPQPAAAPAALLTSRTTGRRTGRRRRRRRLAAALVALFFGFFAWRFGASAAAGAGGCGTPRHALVAAGLPAGLGLLLPRVAAVGAARLWRPRIVETGGPLLRSTETAKGCANRTRVRASRVVVEARTGLLFGARVNRTLEGVAAACAQHLVDVLGGTHPCA